MIVTGNVKFWYFWRKARADVIIWPPSMELALICDGRNAIAVENSVLNSSGTGTGANMWRFNNGICR